MKLEFRTASFGFNYKDTAYMVGFVEYSDRQYRVDIITHGVDHSLQSDVVTKLETTHPTKENAFRILTEYLNNA